MTSEYSIPDAEPSPYNLTDQQRRWIFDHQVVPSVLSGGVRQQRPAVVYLMSQPGAGKTSTAQIITESLNRRGGAIRFCSDFFKPHHPRYLDLLSTHPRDAGKLIRADYKQWKTWGEEHVAAKGVDAVIEIAPGSPEQFRASAARFANQGYEVDVVLLGVPDAQSRLGTALRFADQLRQNDGVGRFPTAEGHDQCYQAVADIARQIDAGQVPVDNAMVARRGLYRPPAVEGGVSEALHAERTRPLDAAQVHQFTAGVTRLHRELGAPWRREVIDIVNRAEPLIPAETRQGLLLQGTAPSPSQPRPPKSPAALQGPPSAAPSVRHGLGPSR